MIALRDYPDRDVNPRLGIFLLKIDQGEVSMTPQEKQRKSLEILWFPSSFVSHNSPNSRLSQHFPKPLILPNPSSSPTPPTD
ncbi:hypothetical protein L596_023721 [Steinernema carpocapsae]|uniref:Uncharacterized protein n=1 Tax=Steinernema carpocapsae TaxID=34508 RepID=A0A4U5MER0_STECR|nr:hypothetical protein L596_023721 [Steinernema carpocapsae]